MSKSKFDLFETGTIVARQKKEKAEKEKVLSIRFTVYNSRVEFSKDLMDTVFDCCNSIKFALVREDDEGNEVDLIFIKGYKGKVSKTTLVDAHPIKTIKRSGRKYLDLNQETLKEINPKLIRSQGGVKSRLYTFSNDDISASECIAVIDNKSNSKWTRNSKDRVKKKYTNV